MTRLVSFGASTMQGAGDSQRGFFTRLSRCFQKQRLPLEMGNEGVGGQTTRGMLARMHKLHSLIPYDLVVILGCIDMPFKQDGSASSRTTHIEYLANLEKLPGTIRGKRSLSSVSSPSPKKEQESPLIYLRTT